MYPHAPGCPNCGYQPATNRTDELLGSIVTVSSILIGFTLSALVQVTSGETRSDGLVQVATGCWVASSVLLVGVLIGAETARRREFTGGRLLASAAEDEHQWTRCEWLLTTFTVALLAAACGVVVIAFFFSAVHGVVGCLSAAVALILIRRVVQG